MRVRVVTTLVAIFGTRCVHVPAVTEEYIYSLTTHRYLIPTAAAAAAILFIFYELLKVKKGKKDDAARRLHRRVK